MLLVSVATQRRRFVELAAEAQGPLRRVRQFRLLRSSRSNLQLRALVATDGLVESGNDLAHARVAEGTSLPLERARERETLLQRLHGEVVADGTAEVGRAHDQHEDRIDPARRRQDVLVRLPLLRPEVGRKLDEVQDHPLTLDVRKLRQGAVRADNAPHRRVQAVPVDADRAMTSFMRTLLLLFEQDHTLQR